MDSVGISQHQQLLKTPHTMSCRLIHTLALVGAVPLWMYTDIHIAHVWTYSILYVHAIFCTVSILCVYSSYVCTYSTVHTYIRIYCSTHSVYQTYAVQYVYMHVPEHQKVLHHFLPEVVIDTVDHFFLEQPTEVFWELSWTFAVFTKRFLHHNTTPATSKNRKHQTGIKIHERTNRH